MLTWPLPAAAPAPLRPDQRLPHGHLINNTIPLNLDLLIDYFAAVTAEAVGANEGDGDFCGGRQRWWLLAAKSKNQRGLSEGSSGFEKMHVLCMLDLSVARFSAPNFCGRQIFDDG